MSLSRFNIPDVFWTVNADDLLNGGMITDGCVSTDSYIFGYSVSFLTLMCQLISLYVCHFNMGIGVCAMVVPVENSVV